MVKVTHASYLQKASTKNRNESQINTSKILHFVYTWNDCFLILGWQASKSIYICKNTSNACDNWNKMNIEINRKDMSDKLYKRNIISLHKLILSGYAHYLN